MFSHLPVKGRKCFIATLKIRKLKLVGKELGLEPYSVCQTTPQHECQLRASWGGSLPPFQEDVDSKEVNLN